MISISDEQFDQMITIAMDELPEAYIKGLQNVVIVFEDDPTTEQRTKQKLAPWQTLFGLYEGIPRTSRGNNYNLVLPDKITLFKNPLQQASTTLAGLQENVKRTLWHEIAHYYGLDHEHIDKIEHK